jgi:hypothetical protein
MQLIVNGASIAVAQMGPAFLLVITPIDYPPDVACVALQVDESERRWDVRLPDGISADNRRVAIAVKGS